MVNGVPFDVHRGDKVVVGADVNANDLNGVFMVSEVRVDLVELMWICNVVPFREQKNPTADPTLNNKWLKQ